MTAAPVLPRVEPALAWPAPGALRELRSMLLAAQRPFVIAGGSGWDAEACAALQRFAENWQLPVGYAFRFQDTFDNRHPLYAGDVGIGINPKLSARIRDADLVIALGVRLGEMTTGGYTLLQAPRPQQKLIHIHAGSGGTRPRLRRRPDAAVGNGQCREGAGSADGTAAAAVGRHAAAAHADYHANLVAPAVEPLDMAVVMKTVQRLLPEDTVYTNGAGNYSGWLHRYVQYPGLQHHGRTQLAPTSGAMGYGVPAAVAAALLEPDRWVVNVAGDGDFLMTGQELATATGYGANKLISVVVDNGTYGTIRMHQEREYPGRVDLRLVRPAQERRWRCVSRTAAAVPRFRPRHPVRRNGQHRQVLRGQLGRQDGARRAGPAARARRRRRRLAAARAGRRQCRDRGAAQRLGRPGRVRLRARCRRIGAVRDRHPRARPCAAADREAQCRRARRAGPDPGHLGAARRHAVRRRRRYRRDRRGGVIASAGATQAVAA